MYPQVPSSLSHLKFKRIDSRNCYRYVDDKVHILKSYNTIVAVAVYVNGEQIAFIDEYKYSGYTSTHIGIFIRRFVKGIIHKYIFVSQSHLIDIITKAIAGNEIKLDIRYRFNQGDYVQIYRLHNNAGKIVRVKKPSTSFYYAFRVDKNCKENYFTPAKYAVSFMRNETITDSSGRSYDCLSYINLRNLKPLEGGV